MVEIPPAPVFPLAFATAGATVSAMQQNDSAAGKAVA
jgi:hypothetical protein